MFSRYYQAELAYLRDVGRSFATTHPALAPLLAERSGDPDVERLLEGFAFLTARVRERADDAIPEVVEGLCDLLLPHYLRTVPAASILEFHPHAQALRARQRVPRGTQVASVPVEGTRCLFRTTQDLDLLPLQLEEVSQDGQSALAPILRLRFRTTESGVTQVFQPAGMRLYVHGELPTAMTLFLWLCRFAREVRVVAGDRRATLPASSIVPVGLAPESALLPWPSYAPEGLRLLQEYFTLPQKLLFVDLRGLDAALDVAAERFEIAIQLERPPELPSRLARDGLRLHCAPVVNLFPCAAAPVREGAFSGESLLRAADLDPAHMEVHSVDEVVGLAQGRRGRRTYRPFVDYAHAAPGAQETAYYKVRRARSPVDDAVDTFLSVLLPQDVSRDARLEPDQQEVLSIDLTCSNRSLPGQLRVGDVSAPAPSSPTTARFSNLVPLSTPLRPPFGSDLHWRVLAHLALGQRTLADAQSLRALIELYNFQTHADERAARANRLRAEAISRVTCTPARRLFEGAPLWGVRALVELDDAGFAGKGDAFLFGIVLDELFGASVSINAFSELQVRLVPSQAEWVWPARNGRQAIV